MVRVIAFEASSWCGGVFEDIKPLYATECYLRWSPTFGALIFSFMCVFFFGLFHLARWIWAVFHGVDVFAGTHLSSLKCVPWQTNGIWNIRMARRIQALSHRYERSCVHSWHVNNDSHESEINCMENRMNFFTTSNCGLCFWAKYVFGHVALSWVHSTTSFSLIHQSFSILCARLASFVPNQQKTWISHSTDMRKWVRYADCRHKVGRSSPAPVKYGLWMGILLHMIK